jgi:thymidylate kinase
MFDKLSSPECCDERLTGRARELTVKERLLDQRSRYTEILKEINDAISALDANPEIEKVLTLVGKTIRY